MSPKRIAIAAVFAIVFGGLICWWTWGRDIVEPLNSPIAVAGWDAHGLRLTDGRRVALPGIPELPSSSRTLAEVTRSGVEVAADGRVYGSLRIWHWCGNDTTGTHIARVDIANLMTYLGRVDSAPNLEELPADEVFDHFGRGFSKWGWDVSAFYRYRQFHGDKAV